MEKLKSQHKYEIMLSLPLLINALKKLPNPHANQGVSYSNYCVRCFTDGRIVIQSRNLVCIAEITILNEADNSEDFAFLLDPIRFAAFTWQSADTVTFVFDADVGVLSLKGTRNKISVAKIDDFTEIVFDDCFQGQVTVPPAVKNAFAYCSTDQSKAVLSNILFKDNYILATDSYRLWHLSVENTVAHSLVIPAALLTLIFKNTSETFVLDYFVEDNQSTYYYADDTFRVQSQINNSGYPEQAITLIPDYTDSFTVCLSDLGSFSTTVKKLGTNNTLTLASSASQITLSYLDDTAEMALVIAKDLPDDPKIDLCLAADKISHLSGTYDLFVPSDRLYSRPVLFKRDGETILVMPVMR
jgi:hypothetical protein